MRQISDTVKAECLQLRTRDRLSLQEIHLKTGVSKGTLSGLLRDVPLTRAEIRSRAGVPSNKGCRKYQATQSNLHKAAISLKPDTNQVSKISEAAILLRLSVFGFSVFSILSGGELADWIAKSRNGNLVKIQVKTAHRGANGMPSIILARGKHRIKYKNGDWDFVVGYDQFADKAYVYSWNEVQDKFSVSLKQEDEERWDKIDSTLRDAALQFSGMSPSLANGTTLGA